MLIYILKKPVYICNMFQKCLKIVFQDVTINKNKNIKNNGYIVP